jgi:hypothetical protein
MYGVHYKVDTDLLLGAVVDLEVTCCLEVGVAVCKNYPTISKALSSSCMQEYAARCAEELSLTRYIVLRLKHYFRIRYIAL